MKEEKSIVSQDYFRLSSESFFFNHTKSLLRSSSPHLPGRIRMKGAWSTLTQWNPNDREQRTMGRILSPYLSNSSAPMQWTYPVGQPCIQTKLMVRLLAKWKSNPTVQLRKYKTARFTRKKQGEELGCMLFHLDQEKLINYHNKQYDMFLNPCQNLVWAPLWENPPIISSSQGR